jgi:CheY-like chemotaxis protein
MITGEFFVMFFDGSRKNGVVLVVEDDPDVRQTAVELLEANGFTAIEAANGREALEILSGDPTIRVMFTDVMMPGISGTTLAQRALAIRPGLEVLLTSAFLRDAAAGDLEVLQKPYREEDLVARLERRLRQ